MNGTRNNKGISAKSVPQYEVVNCVGVKSPVKFDTAAQAVEAAKLWFPEQEQDPERTGKGWDVQVVGCD